jgi:hypothetical protein
MKTSLTKPKHSLFNGARSPPQASFLLINSCRLTHVMPMPRSRSDLPQVSASRQPDHWAQQPFQNLAHSTAPPQLLNLIKPSKGLLSRKPRAVGREG